MKMDKRVAKYTKSYKKELAARHYSDADGMSARYARRLEEMYDSDIYREHNIYPTMNVELIYSVIAMCLELREYGLSDDEIIDFCNGTAEKRRKFFDALAKTVNILPNSYKITEKWNIGDHKKRLKDRSITYDIFQISDGKIEYNISKCMYVEMFEYYGIRGLCKIFCTTDERIYALIPKHVRFVRHSDLSDGDCCHDEIFDRAKE